ncbi:MAG: lysophospholipid acyltransferase family protein [Caulobacteraceae bacterium]
MKRLLRSPKVQAAITAIAAAYLRFVYATLRWRREGVERRDAVFTQPERGVLICFWHGGIPLCTTAWPLGDPKVQEMRALISRSLDGQLIAGLIARLGVPAIRGSKAQEARRTREKGGSEALRDMVRWVKAGGAVAVTPDGPRGPARVMGDGPAMLARLSSGQVLLMGIATAPAIRLNSWDGSFIPLPFARAAIVWDGPFEAGRDDPAVLTHMWQAALNRVTERAEALVA